jgi:uncharacterized protein YraI
LSFVLALFAITAQAQTSAKPAAKGKSVTIQLDAPVGGRAYVTGHLLNCRTDPSPDAEILTTIPRGTAVSVRRQNGDWQLLKLKTKSCWSHTQFLSTSEVKKEAKTGD